MVLFSRHWMRGQESEPSQPLILLSAFDCKPVAESGVPPVSRDPLLATGLAVTRLDAR